MKDNSNANKYTNVNLGEHIPERKFQLFKRGATSPGVYSSYNIEMPPSSYNMIEKRF